MTHHTDAERAEFEAAIRATMHDAGEDHIAERLERWPDGAYKDRATGYAWWGYQKAARRAPAVPVPQVTDAMIEAAEEAYMPFGDMHLAIQAALAAAPQPPEAEQASVSNGTLAAPVQFPEPVAYLHPDASCATTDHYYKTARWVPLYTEQQVRQILAAHGIKVAP